jgi:hypothetical protein
MTLQYQYTDSASWVGAVSSNYYGYEFTPRSGTVDQPNGSGGNGSVWTIINGNWPSTYSNGGGPVGEVVKQAPRNSAILEGEYTWAISVSQVNDSTNEVRWSFVKKDDKYWFAGSVLAPAVTDKFNGVGFWTKDGEHTQLNITYCEVDQGDPIPIPKAPWEDYFLDTWGFIGDRTGGWTNETGLDGDFYMSGESALSNWVAARGAFDAVEPEAGDMAYVVQGDIVLEDGGFQDWSALRLGIFYGDSVGTVAIDSAMDSSLVWTGMETHHSGYLFMPQSGTNTVPTWSGDSDAEGTFGAIVDGNWISTNNANAYVLGTDLQNPAGAVATAGTYAFKMGVQLLEDGAMEIAASITNGDDYEWEAHAIDSSASLPTTMFNGAYFGLNNSTTTEMRLEYVEITQVEDLSDVVSIEVEKLRSGMPTSYSLDQNYPNPFNPATKIKFGLPEQSDVKLVVYDVLGRVVAEVANKKMSAGYHEFTFNAGRFATGIYFYRIEAGDFVKVKKMMLLK